MKANEIMSANLVNIENVNIMKWRKWREMWKWREILMKEI